MREDRGETYARNQARDPRDTGGKGDRELLFHLLKFSFAASGRLRVSERPRFDAAPTLFAESEVISTLGATAR